MIVVQRRHIDVAYGFDWAEEDDQYTDTTGTALCRVIEVVASTYDVTTGSRTATLDDRLVESIAGAPPPSSTGVSATSRRRHAR